MKPGPDRRSGAIVAAIMQATAREDEPAIPPEQEALELLSEAARAGSVPAMRELRVYWREQSGQPNDDEFFELDQLARRRARGTAA
jgi:hypothetical protein